MAITTVLPRIAVLNDFKAITTCCPHFLFGCFKNGFPIAMRSESSIQHRHVPDDLRVFRDDIANAIHYNFSIIADRMHLLDNVLVYLW